MELRIHEEARPASVACLATAAAARGASISFYISPPAVQFSEVAGTTVATFDSLARGI